MPEEIELEDLDPTVNFSLDHVVAAQKNGLTVKVTLSQIVELAKGAIVGDAPEDLDTLFEIALAMSNDPDFLSSILPAGSVISFASETAPSGFIKANGALLSRTTYSAMFANIGTTFGIGDGSTTFGTPDLRGVFTRHFDDGRGYDSGRVFGSYQAWAIENMSGVLADAIGLLSGTGVFESAGAGSSLRNSSGSASTSKVSFNPSLQVNVADETRPENVALLACIKY